MSRRPFVTLVVPVRRSRILITSFGASLALAICAITVLAFTGTASAKTCTLTTTAPTTLWANAGNWSCAPSGGFPGSAGSGDTAVISLGGGYTMQISSTISANVQISTIIPVDVVSGGTLTLESSSAAVSGTTLKVDTGGTLAVANGAALTTVQSNIHLNGGTLSIPAGTSLQIGSGSSFTFDGGSIQGPGTLAIPSGTTLTLAGATSPMAMTDGVSIDNSGTLNYTSSSNAWSVDNGAGINNFSSALITLQNDLPVNTDGAFSPTIANSGDIQKLSGTSSTFNMAVDVGPTGQISPGTRQIILAGGGTHTGTFNLPSSTSTVAFNGTHVFNSGAAIGTSPAGNFNILGGAFQLNTPLSVPNVKQTGGTLTGNSDLTVTTSYDWAGGDMAATAANVSTQLGTGTLNIDPSTAVTLNGRIINSSGPITYNPTAGGSLDLTSSGKITAGGSFNLKSDTTITSSDLSGSMTITGSLTKSVGTRTLLNPSVSVGPTASVTPAASTTIAFGGGGNFGGSTTSLNTSAANSHIEFAGGFNNLNTGTSVNSGDFLLTGGTLKINTPLTIATMTESGGTLKDSTTLTVGNFTWTAGTMDGDTGGTGTLAIASPNGIATINGVGSPVITHRFTFTNGGLVHFQPASALAVNQGGQIVNNGTWQFENNAGLGSDGNIYLATSPLFTNSGGTISQTVGGTTFVAVPLASTGNFTFNNGSDIEFTSLVALNGGTITFNNGGDVFGIRGTVTIPISPVVTFNGPGVVRVSNGGALSDSQALTVSGFELQNGGTFDGNTVGTITANNTFKSTGGTIQNGILVIGSGVTAGDMTTLADSPAISSGSFVNNGTLNYTTAFPIQFQGNALFQNNASGTLNIVGPGGTSSSGSGNGFTNFGTITRTGSTGFFVFDLPFTNTGGTVDSQVFSALFAFAAGGTMSSGTMKGSVVNTGIEFSGGTFTVTGGNFGTVGGVKVNGGTLHLKTAVSAPKQFFLNGGSTLDGTGGGILNLPANSFASFSGGSVSNISINDVSTTSTTINTATAPITFDNMAFGINGTATWTGGTNQLLLTNGTTFTISGNLDLTASGTIATAGTTPVISVTTGGNLTKKTNTGPIGIAAKVQAGGGTIGSLAGALQLNYTGTSSETGTFNTNGGTIELGNSGTYNFTGVTGTGSTALRVLSGTVNLLSPTTLNNLYLGTGTIAGPSTLSFTGIFDWDGGTLSAATTNSGGTLHLLGGSGAMTLGANFTGGTTNLSSSTSPFSINSGFTYTSNGTFTMSNDGPVTGLGTFTNAGTLTKSAGTTSTIGTTFNNTGTVNPSVGELELTSGGTDTGVYSAASGTAIEFNGGTRTLTAASNVGAAMAGTLYVTSGSVTVNGAFNPSGTVDVNGGTLTLDHTGTAVLNDLWVRSGTLTGASPVQVNGTSGFWNGGTITGTGGLTINGGAIFTVSAASTVNLIGRTLTNAGTINFTTPITLQMTNATINNQATGLIDLKDDNGITVTGTSTINNAGILQKTAGAGASILDATFNNTGTVKAQTGTLKVANFTQSAGSTGLTGGILASSQTLNFTGGALGGGGTINAALTNSGATIDPGTNLTPGNLTLTGGAFNQSGTGVLITDLFANNSNDSFTVTGNPANLGGKLKVQLAGGYTPASGDSFTVLNSSALTDTSLKQYPVYGPNNTGTFNSAASPTTLTLVALIPQADMQITSTAPGTAVHTTTWPVTLNAKNNGPDGATGVTVTINITNGTFAAAAPSSGSCTGTGPVTCTLGAIGASGTGSIVVSVTASSLGTVSVGASITANEIDPTASNNTTSASATVQPKSDLGVAITDSPDPVNAGATVVYTYAVTNAGPDSTNAALAAAITAGTISSVGSGCAIATATTANCTATGIPATGFTNFTINVTAPGNGPITATGTITASGSVDQNTTNNNASNSTAVTPQADLQIVKTGPSSVASGQSAVYTITVTNNGPSDAFTVQVDDPTPAGLTFSGNSGNCTSAYPCSLATINAGQSKSIVSTYTTSPGQASSSVNNTATVTSSTNDGIAGNNSSSVATTIGPSADLQVSVTGPGSAFPGSQVTVTVKVLNAGPSDANGISISSSAPPSSLSFVSNTGACTTGYPCTIGSLASGQFVLIQSTYNVNSGGAAATVTYSRSSGTPDPNNGNDSASITISTGCPTTTPALNAPGNGATEIPAGGGTLSWSDVGAAKYNVYLGPAGSGCSTLYGTVVMGSARVTKLNYSGLTPGVLYEWSVEAVTSGCSSLKSACATFTTATNCNAAAPVPTSPVGGTLSNPITFTWSASNGATLYTVRNAAGDSVIGTSTTTSLAGIFVADGPLTWYVVADVPLCGALRSANATVNLCSPAPAPLVGVIAQATSGQTYAVEWARIPGVSAYELDEATNDAFANAVTTTFGQPNAGANISAPFTKTATTGPLPFYYRVRAKSVCAEAFGPYSEVIHIVVIPPPPKTQKNPSVNVPVGSTQVVVQQVFVAGIADGAVHTFTATVDKPWLHVVPPSGVLPSDGITLDVTANPTALPNGTETGTVLVIISTAGSAKSGGSEGSTTVTVPVSVNLVTPILPSSKDLPPPNTLIIPSVGHLDGLNSHWQSDIRLANTGSQKVQYALKFSPADPSNGGVKTTTIDVDGGATTALDDIVRNWYGIGALGESTNGVLEVRPIAQNGKGAPEDTPSVSKVTVVSSRTYSVSSNGTLGQYIPAIPFGSFIAKAAQGAAATVLSLQQIAQSDQFRTNLGIVEGAGQPANVLVSVFDIQGRKLIDVPLSLKAGEQMQLNGFLATKGITNLSDGRIEVKVSSGEGRVTAYASVVDNATLDPLLVSGVAIGGSTTNHYVLPGVADLNTGLANWRTDMRVFNSSKGLQNMTLTFFPQGGGTSVSKDISINAGEIRTLDSVVANLFQLTNAGGAVHVTTPGNSNLIVTGRTYNATSAGTFGQFIPAVTQTDSIGNNEGTALHILQVEDSVRYRTNLGLAEVTGKPVGVDIFVNLPDTKVTPVIHIDLAANEFQQLNPFRALGMENVYNARLTVRVTDGTGRVAAYGSVIDMTTNDPTFVPAQQ
jgi:uncharacterized repeat protein (TIGR01451 family)